MSTHLRLRDWVKPFLWVLAFFTLITILGVWVAHSVESVSVLKIIISCTSIVSGFASIFAATGDLVDKDVNSNKKGLDKLNTRGWFFFVSTILLMLMPILQSMLQDSIDNAKELATRTEQDKKDAKLKKTYDSTINVIQANSALENRKTVSTISSAFGKYGFKFDSIKMELVEIKNQKSSTNQEILPVFKLLPTQGIVYVKKSSDYFYYNIRYSSNDAGSTNFKVKASILWRDSSQGLVHGDMFDFLPYNTKLSITTFQTLSIVIPTIWHYNTMYLWLRGSYTSLSGKLVLYIDEVYTIDKSDNKFWILMDGPERLSIIKAAKELKPLVMMSK